MKRIAEKENRPAAKLIRNLVAGRSFILPILYAMVGVPLCVLILYAFADRWPFPALVPTDFGVRGWRYVAGGIGRVLGSMASSLVYSLATVLASLLVCMLPASVLARYDFLGRRTIEGILLMPVLVPAITFAMGIHYLFIKGGLADTWIGVVLVLTVVSYPYMLRALTAGFRSYSPDMDWCAANLGAGLLRRILRVHVPMLMPAIVAGGTVVFLVAFSEYFLVFRIGGGVVSSYSGFLFPFISSSDRAVASVLILLFLVPPLVLFGLIDRLVARRYRNR